MKQLFSSFIYENPLPQLRARQSAFPNVCEIAPSHLLAAHQMGEAFESVDGATYVSESTDGGRSWSAPRRACAPDEGDIPLSDCAKLTRLQDGRLVLFGYEFYREDPELPLSNAQTGGLLTDRVFYALSADNGKTWTRHIEVPTAWNGHTEASAPLTVLQDGSWATPIAGFPRWDGSAAGRTCGRLLRSTDCGRSWNDDAVCMAFPSDTVACYEQRMCQTGSGVIAVIAWNEDLVSGKRLNNHIALSVDGGHTFSAPIDTGVGGQSAGILSLGAERILTLHAVRRDTDRPGIYACIGEITGGELHLGTPECVWQPNVPMTRDTHMAGIFSFLKFGQPGAVRLSDGTVLMTHWICEDGCYKTCTTAFQI